MNPFYTMMAKNKARDVRQERAGGLRDRLGLLERRELLLAWGASLAVLLAAWALGLGLVSSAIQKLRDAGLVTAMLAAFAIYTVCERTFSSRERRRLLRRLLLTVASHARVRAADRLAMVDPLTGLFTRQFAWWRIESDMARARRQAMPLRVLAFDLDEYLSIRDAYGPAAAEEMLRAFAGRLQQAGRGYDLAARTGGDEFLLVLPECRLGHAFRVLKRLLPVEVEIDGDKVPVTFFIGWAHYQPGETLEDFFERAARELALDKRDDGVRTIVSYLEGVSP